MQLEIVDAARVREILTMAACIEVLDAAMRAVSKGEIAAPPRLFAPLADGSGELGLMPGSTTHLDVYGAKILSLHPGNPDRGLPTIQGLVMLFDRATGAPRALIDAAELTAIRTAAASALATRELALAEASTHGIFGTGVQAVTHLDAIAAVRSIERTVVHGRDPDRTAAWARAQRERTGREVEATDDPRVAAGCDVVSTVTAATEPVLRGAWVKPGAHVNLVGAHTASTREADSDLVAGARVYVDSLGAALEEAGDLLMPIAEGRFTADHVVGEIGQLLEGRVPGRRSRREVTAYLSVGIVAQDLYAADYVLRQVANSKPA